MFADGRWCDVPQSEVGPLVEAVETVVPQVLANLKTLRLPRRPSAMEAKIAAAELALFGRDNELLDFSEALIFTMEQLRTKDFQPPKLELSNSFDHGTTYAGFAQSVADEEDEPGRIMNQLQQRYMEKQGRRNSSQSTVRSLRLVLVPGIP